MRTTKSEFSGMFSAPEEFVNLALDTCDKQESECVKTKAASLLEAMCDNVDGSVSSLVKYCVDAINQEQAIPAETCLVALTVVSYILPKREDLVPLFQDCLAANITKLLFRHPDPKSSEAGTSIILRARMSLLLGYYADMIFT